MPKSIFDQPSTQTLSKAVHIGKTAAALLTPMEKRLLHQR